MTYEEAVSALTIDAAAVVFAGRDFDALAASFGSAVDLDASSIVADARKASALAPDAATRLMILTNARVALGAILAAREKARADALRRIEDDRRAVAELHRERGAAEERRQRAFRATFPIFQNLRARIQAVETQFGEAASPVDLAAAEHALEDVCATASASLAVACASFFPAR